MLSVISIASAQTGYTADKITISNVTVEPGGVEKYFDISLDGNDVSYTAYEISLVLPEGLDVAYTNAGKLRITMRKPSLYPYSIEEVENDEGEMVEEKSYTHTLAFSYGTAGEKTLKVMCYSSQNESFTSTDGALFRVYVKASAYLKPGDAIIKSKDVVFTTKDETQYNIADADLTINVSNQSSLSLKVSSKNQWSTCVLPFTTSVPAGLTVYEANETFDEYLKLRKTETMEAYKPYILYAENGYEGALSGTVDASKYVTVASHGPLNGAIVQQQINAGYVLQNQGQGAMFYNTHGGSFTIPAGKCWLTPLENNAKCYSFITETSSISNISKVNGKKSIYTLDGKRVCTPQRGYIYIINGQKVIKK